MYGAPRRRQTRKHVYLIRLPNGPFHPPCLRTWGSREVFPNTDGVSSVSEMAQKQDMATGREAYLSTAQQTRLFFFVQHFEVHVLQTNTQKKQQTESRQAGSLMGRTGGDETLYGIKIRALNIRSVLETSLERRFVAQPIFHDNHTLANLCDIYLCGSS